MSYVMLAMPLQLPKQAMCSGQGHLPCCTRRLQQAICRLRPCFPCLCSRLSSNVQSTLKTPGQGQVRLQIPDMLASAFQVSPDKDLPQVDKNCLLVFIKFYDPKTGNLKVTAMS